jgi:hypothetical protein
MVGRRTTRSDRRLRRAVAWAGLLLCACAAGAAGARSVGGVDVPERLEVGGSKLVLNGAGIRTRYFIDVAVTALYLSEPSADAASIIAADEHMAVRMHVISRFVTRERMVESVEHGFELSTDGKTAPIREEIDALLAVYGDTIAQGDVYDIVYVPGTGLEMFKNGEPRGTVASGLVFKRALFGVWLSERPVQKSLKRELLGL